MKVGFSHLITLGFLLRAEGIRKKRGIRGLEKHGKGLTQHLWVWKGEDAAEQCLMKGMLCEARSLGVTSDI